MRVFSTIIGIFIIVVIVWDGFETMVLPRRVTRRFRLTGLFYRSSWMVWSKAVRTACPAAHQESLLGIYGPLSLLVLLVIWAAGLIVGFGLLYWAYGYGINAPEGFTGFGTALYMSGTTFFTLGLGDVTPFSRLLRALTVAEAGMGFGLLAVLIGHLPSLNQSFSRREVNISLLDARAGSPPTAFGIVHRHLHEGQTMDLRQFLYDWEQWSAELLESHLSYPVLAMYRSQHENQSWLAALTAVLDVSAFMIAVVKGASTCQARLTFAMARHAVVDLALIFKTPPHDPPRDRLPKEEFLHMRESLAEAGLSVSDEEDYGELTELRRMYEPYVFALSAYLCLDVPSWMPSQVSGADNWQTSAWERASISVDKDVRHTRNRHF